MWGLCIPQQLNSLEKHYLPESSFQNVNYITPLLIILKHSSPQSCLDKVPTPQEGIKLLCPLTSVSFSASSCISPKLTKLIAALGLLCLWCFSHPILSPWKVKPLCLANSASSKNLPWLQQEVEGCIFCGQQSLYKPLHSSFMGMISHVYLSPQTLKLSCVSMW